MLGKYYEEDSIFKVEILKDMSTENEEKFKLKIIDIIKESKIFKPPEIGETFIFSKKKNVYCPGLGRLEIMDIDNGI